MKKIDFPVLRRIAALLCAMLLVLGSGCRAATSDPAAQAQPTTLRLLLLGKANGLDRVLDALYDQMDPEHSWRLDITLMDNTDYEQVLARILTAHEDYDLVFDAPWLSLNAQAEQHSYKSLDSYFSNPDYPALQQAFSEAYLNANRLDGKLYGIPFTSTYYDVPGIFYRQDLLESLQLGFTSITTREQMLQYWQALADAGEIAPIALGARGFYLLNQPDISLRQANIWDLNGWSFWNYPAKVVLSEDGRTVLDVVFPGDSAEHFQNLPAPYNQDFLLDCFLKNAEYARYLNPDDLLQEDGSLVFNRGEAASFEGTLGSGGTAAVQKQVCQNVPGAKVGFWSYDPAFTPENCLPGAVPVSYNAWNFLCIPSYSTKADEAMAFLDWLYSDVARLDLFNYGVEGQDREAVGQEEYRLLDNPAGAYSFPGYELSWTPVHHRLDTTLPAEEKALMEYVYDPASYTDSPLSGFSVNFSRIGIETACLGTLFETYYTGLTHGSYGSETAAVVQQMHQKSVELGLETVRAELIRQIQQHLDAREDGV